MPLGFARANPLPLVPLPGPRTTPPRPAPGPFVPPRLFGPDVALEVGAGVVNLDADFEEEGFSTNDVSVVLAKNRKLIAHGRVPNRAHMNVVSPSRLCRSVPGSED